MNKTEIVNSLTRTFYKTKFQLKKHSPEILAVAGVAGVVTSGVMACKATTKLNGILDDAKNQIDSVHGVLDGQIKIKKGTKYTEEDGKKDLFIIYVQTGVKVAKLYAPSVILGTLSITALLSSNNILRKRNVALAAAYATVDKSFKDYRGRVIERFGEELDKEIKYNLKTKEVEETVIVDEKGKKKKIKETINVMDPNDISDFARIYDDGCAGWQKDPEANLMFLKLQQAHANDKLKAQGYLFLNDVYEMLGIPKTKAGFMVGWLYDEKQPVGDNFVDFGIYNVNNERSNAFVNGYERNILLDFNVDGNILNKM